MTNETAAVEVRRLRKVFGGARPFEAISDLSLSVAPGEIVCLVGPSGAGKTTLLRCIAGLAEPTGGEVLLGGHPVSGPPEEMAVVFQEYGRSLFPWMTVGQNVELPLKEKRVPKARRTELVGDALKAVGLSGSRGSYPWKLSGGMQQRVAIARAVAYEPRVLLMDEPFAAVDAQTRADLEDLVRSLWHTLGITVIFVTHDIDEAIYLGHRVVALSMTPTAVMDDVRIDLPDERDQLGTRSLPRFDAYRKELYGHIQRAKAGERPAAETAADPVPHGARRPSPVHDGGRS